MRTFVVLLSCLVCCVTAGRLSLTQKQGSTYENANQRQQFLLDVLLQVQKPLVNTELIQMGEVLVTEPNMYTQPNDVILQDFLQLANNQAVLGRNDAYNPVDITTLRQLVGLQRFFVLAHDFQVFQKNVVYARLYINPVLFVDALTLALRVRPDTQDLIMPAANEILPNLYYDYDILYAAQNVNFEQLASEVPSKTTKSGIGGLFGGLFPIGKYINYKPWLQRRMQSIADSGWEQFGMGNQEITAKVVIPVAQRDGLSAELAKDIQLDVTWRNIIIDQMAQAAIEGIAKGQKIGGIHFGKAYSQQGEKVKYQQAVAQGVEQQQYGEYLTYMNPFYGYGYQGDGANSPYGQPAGAQQHQGTTQYGYNERYGPQEYQQPEHGSYEVKRAQYGYQTLKYDTESNGQYDYEDQQYDPSYAAPYGRQPYQRAQYDSKNRKSASYYRAERQQNQIPYGYKNQEYVSSYTGIYRPQQTERGAQYGYNNPRYGYDVKNQYQTQFQSQPPYKPYGPVNINYMTVNKDDEGRNVLNRRVRSSHNQQRDDRHNRNDERKRDSKIDDKQNGEYDVTASGEFLQYTTAAEKLSYERRGEILLQSLQELAARLNIERIVDAVEGNQYKQQQYYIAQNQQQIGQLMQQMRTLIEEVLEERNISKSSEATLNVIADIINGRLILEQEQLSSVVQSTLLAVQQKIANIRGYQAGAVYELIPLALFFGNLRDRQTQQIIISFAELIADYRQELRPYTKEQLIDDIAVQNVKITPLITYSEYYDADLVNLLDEQLLQSNTNNLQRLSQKVVARQQRLNHEPFTISMDIAVEEPKEVAVRVLLVPQIDNNGRRVSLSEYPPNYIVIDTFVERLKAGKNYIQRSSRQFNGYNNDATISQLYYQVMTGQVSEQQYQTSSIRQLPRNLLLPRGANVNGGLPVQILVIATPLTQQNHLYLSEAAYTQGISGFGISAVGADQLPLGYPLDRQVLDKEALNVPNIQVIETGIQHENSIRG